MKQVLTGLVLSTLLHGGAALAQQEAVLATEAPAKSHSVQVTTTHLIFFNRDVFNVSRLVVYIDGKAYRFKGSRKVEPNVPMEYWNSEPKPRSPDGLHLSRNTATGAFHATMWVNGRSFESGEVTESTGKPGEPMKTRRYDVFYENQFHAVPNGLKPTSKSSELSPS